jgi:metal-responsive CopG/Arc/MetJ family transcriptional regulator
VKTAVSLPDELFLETDALARRRGVPRSHVIRDALVAYLRDQRGEEITRALNEVYSREPSELDPVWLTAQAMAMPDEEW